MNRAGFRVPTGPCELAFERPSTQRSTSGAAGRRRGSMGSGILWRGRLRGALSLPEGVDGWLAASPGACLLDLRRKTQQHRLVTWPPAKLYC